MGRKNRNYYNFLYNTHFVYPCNFSMQKFWQLNVGSYTKRRSCFGERMQTALCFRTHCWRLSNSWIHTNIRELFLEVNRIKPETQVNGTHKEGHNMFSELQCSLIYFLNVMSCLSNWALFACLVTIILTAIHRIVNWPLSTIHHWRIDLDKHIRSRINSNWLQDVSSFTAYKTFVSSLQLFVWFCAQLTKACVAETSSN